MVWDERGQRVRINHVGGVIAAASKHDALPLVQVGSISTVKRLVISFQQAGIFPIVVVTGTDEDEVRYQLSGYGVIFVRNEKWEQREMIDSAKTGLRYLQNKCERIVFAPVNVPMVTAKTLQALIAAKGDIVTPSYQGKSGHPVVLSAQVIPEILAFQGKGGLREFIAAMPQEHVEVPVDDPGVLINTHNSSQMEERLAEHNRTLLHPMVQLTLRKESAFFNTRVKLLLYLIYDTHSVRSACSCMALSYGKAWNMLNELEEELGFQVVERKHGGSRGGNTTLTPEGLLFLRRWMQFEEEVFRFTQSRFSSIFL